MSDEEDSVEVQTEEIKQALSSAPTRNIYRPKVVDTGDPEWDEWASSAQFQIDDLIAGSRTLKISVMGIGALSLAAIGIGAITAKIVAQMHKGLSQISENQIEIGRILANSGMLTTAPPQPTPEPDTNHVQPTSAKDLGIDKDAPVAEPMDTAPPGEASELVKKLLANDGPMPNLAEDVTQPINPRHLNTETRIKARPAE